MTEVERHAESNSRQVPRDLQARWSSFWTNRERPIIVAHRYGNSDARAQEAISAGADLLEADVWLHRGRLEARHAKTAGPLPIIWDRWWVNRRPLVPFVAETLLESLPGGTAVMFDLKGRNPRLPRALTTLIALHHGERPFLVCGQNWGMLERFRDVPGIELVHSIGNQQQLDTAWKRLEAGGYDAISIHCELLDARTVARLKESVSAVITWPINTDDELQRVLDFGVDGFTTDSIELMTRVARDKASSSRASSG